MTAAGVRALVPPAVIVGRDPKLRIVHSNLKPNGFHGNVLRSDVDLSRSGMVDRVKGILTSLKISLGITFECKQDHVDCPERLLGSFSFVGANIEESLDSSSGDLDAMKEICGSVKRRISTTLCMSWWRDFQQPYNHFFNAWM